jgi:type I restriction enzyme R subunit
VDECHRAVSDKEMREIKKFFPMSTWFGLTGTPIFEENKKQENGTYARTTSDQYGLYKNGDPLPNGGLLHAYTTKNALDDNSVLGFQVEYNSLINQEEEERVYLSKIKQNYPIDNPLVKLNSMSEIEKEALWENSDFENDAYVETMLKKIFRYQSVMDKFKVVNGMPTMSGILTTHSIAQAKRIYHKLMELKESGKLITGNPLDEKRTLHDPDFPRAAITYSLSEKQEKKNKKQEELLEIMREYDKAFGTHYAEGARTVNKYGKEDETEIDDSNYNQNINNRLARKGAQYQKDGQWLDLVIVVDRLLTGFDAPTIQTLYVDRELKWHNLLQAFSRTNRVLRGKENGMIVTFRKPKTMTENVRNAIKLFSKEDRDWESLIPREYGKVKKDFISAHKDFISAQKSLEEDPDNFKKQVDFVKTFQAMHRLEEAIKSYEDYEVDFVELSPISEIINTQIGHVENVKAEIKEFLSNQGAGEEVINEALEIEFSYEQNAVLKEKIDSYYIAQLLKDIKNDVSKQKFDEVIKNKPAIVKAAYEEALVLISGEEDIVSSVDRYFRNKISGIIAKTAHLFKVSGEDLYTSFSEYQKDKAEVPYINIIIDKSELTKDDFEHAFSKKYRERRKVLEEYWKTEIEQKLLPLKEELVNFDDALKGFVRKNG